MAKIKIELKKPQYLAAKEAPPPMRHRMMPEAGGNEGLPAIFGFLLTLTYVFCAVAAWFIYQRYKMGI